MREVKPWSTDAMKMYTSCDYYAELEDGRDSAHYVDSTLIEFLKSAEGHEVEWCQVNSALFFRVVKVPILDCSLDENGVFRK